MRAILKRRVSLMRAILKRRVSYLFGGFLVFAGVLGGSLFGDGDSRTPARPFQPAGHGSVLSSLGSIARAADPCPAGVFMAWRLPATYVETAPNRSCTGYAVHLKQDVALLCDGSVELEPLIVPAQGVCSKGPCTTAMQNQVDWTINCLDGNVCGNQSNCQGNCEGTDCGPVITCETTDDTCIPPPPSCSTDESLQPISMVTGENTFSIDVFPLPATGGFPPQFSVHWRGARSTTRLSNLMNPLGMRVAHSFSFFLHKIGNTARVTHEGGAVEVFTWNIGTQSWDAAGCRLSTLAAGAPGTCQTQDAILTLQGGTSIRFHDFCGGSDLAEGLPIRMDRPSGDFVAFEIDEGRIEAVQDRIGARVEFEYLGETHLNPYPQLSYGMLVAVDGPAQLVNDKFVFVQDRSVLSAIVQTGGNAIWTLDVDDLTGGIETLIDARGYTERSWTYVADDGLTVDTEAGEGISAPPVSMSVQGATVSLLFDPPGSVSSATNTYTTAGNPPHVVNRTLEGFCPNCGGSNMEKTYWPNTNLVHAVKDGDGFVRVFDLYAGANPGRLFEGCEDTDSDPNTVTPLCTGLTPPARQIDLTYLAGTSVVECRTEPSVAPGQTATDRTFFMADPVDEILCGSAAGDTRPRFVKRSGYTAATLDGEPDDPKTRTTKFAYGGGAPGLGGGAGLEVTQIDGPFYDSGDGTPPSDAPRTYYTYWTAGVTDCNPGWPFPVSANTNRLRSVSQYTSNSTLATQFCSYDRSGRPHYIIQPNGIALAVQYDWRGQITQIIEDAGPVGIPLTTNFEYDANGNLTVVKLPRTTAGGARVGLTYAYSKSDRITEIREGAFSGSSIPTPVQRLTYSYDTWGKPSETLWIDSAGAVRASKKSEYDAFNRLACVARPSGDCQTAAQKTTYEYDPEGLLKAVKDAQNDDVLYGSLADLSKHNRFGQIEKTQQAVCNHPAGQENAPCPLPTATPAVTTYEYDAALHLKMVTIADAIRNGTMVGEYRYDDFGSVLKTISPDTATTLFLHDGAGRLSESQDARQAAAGFKIRYTYDRLGRLILTERVTGSASPLVRYCYDGYDAACGYTNSAIGLSQGHLTAVDDGAGKVKYTYDRYGRITQESRTWNSAAVYTTTYAYDGNGNLTQTTLPHGVAIHREYDDADQISAVTYSAPGISQQPVVGSIKWFPFGGVESWNYQTSGSPKWKLVRDSSGRIIESKMTNANESTSYFSDTYGYASDGNVLRMPASASPPNVLHDSLGRLQQDRFGTSSTQTYAYDHAGNRMSRVAGGIAYSSSWVGPALPPSTLSNRLDQVTWQTNGLLDYGYSDASGNVTYRGYRANGGSLSTTTLSYSDEGLVNAVTTASGTTNYIRDYRALRVEKSGAGGAGWFTFDPGGDLSGWQGPTTGAGNCGTRKPIWKVPHETYIWLDGRPVAVIKSHTQTGYCAGNGFYVDGVFYYMTDKMGLPRVVSKISGLPIPGLPATVWGPATWDAFANPLTTINENPDGDSQTFTVPFRLPGQFALGPLEGGPTTSTGGLQENWFRAYDSLTGRYLQPDPVTLLSPRAMARSPSPFTYANGSPMRFTDRTGTVAIVDDVVVGGALLVAGAAAVTCLVAHDLCEEIVGDLVDRAYDPPPPSGPGPGSGPYPGGPSTPGGPPVYPWIPGLEQPLFPNERRDGPVCEEQDAGLPDHHERCGRAARGSDDDWTAFCNQLPTPQLRARCRENTFENENSKKGFCDRFLSVPY